MLPISIFSFYWHSLFVLFKRSAYITPYNEHYKPSEFFVFTRSKRMLSIGHILRGEFSFPIYRPLTLSVFIFAMTGAPVFLLFQCRRLYCLQLRRVSFFQTGKTWTDAHCTARMQCLVYMNSPGWLETQPIIKIFRCPRIYISHWDQCGKL